MALAKAETDRGMEISAIERLENKIPNSYVRLSAAATKLQLEKAKKCRVNVREIHQRILHTAPTDPTPHNAIYEDLDDRLDIVIERLMEIHQRHIDAAAAAAAAAAPPAQSQVPPHHHHSVKLPELQLPTFDGKYEDWPSFEDLFCATINNNAALSSAQKLQYLKSCTKGEANNLIKSFTITNQHYGEAWTLLQSRYKNTREIITSLIKKILFQPKCKFAEPAALHLLINSVTESVRSLHVLGRPTDTWDDLLVVIMTEKLDPESKSEWAKTLTSTNPPSLSELLGFMENHIRALTAKGSLAPSRQPPQNFNHHHGGNRLRVHHASQQQASQPTCPVCKLPHFLYKCAKLHATPQTQRFQLVQKSSACTNCLGHSHHVNNCPSTHTCKRCSQQHHTLLHRDSRSTHHIGIQQEQPIAYSPPAPAAAAAPQQAGPSSTTRSFHHTSYGSNATQVLLKTAIVLIRDSNGKKHPCRALLDDGSESSFITEACAAALNLRKEKTDVQITGLGSTDAAHAKYIVSARLESAVYSAYVDIEALVLKKITGDLPKTAFVPTWDHLNKLPLADPSFHHPGKIDILLGADVVAAIMRPGLRTGPPCSPTATHTLFGWVLSGRVSTHQSQIIRSFHTSISLDESVQRFWKETQPAKATSFTEEERLCESHFHQNTVRNHEGRYIVRLPFRESHIHNLGDTRRLAESRLLSLERRFEKAPHHRDAYIQFMREYEQLGHMSHSATVSSAGSQCSYIPHHFVLKEDSSTTKLRVVFDASMKSSNGISLNNCMMVGPTIQDSLFAILLRFRMNPVAIKGDIAKMYRQFYVHPDDQDYQRILWREHPSQPIKEYRLGTVTYGTAAAPYLATRCLQQLAKDVKVLYPKASLVLSRDMYVDDLMSGASDDSSGTELVKELNSATAAACMSMRKYASNSPAVMATIPPELREEASSHTFDQDDYVKALGIVWQPKPDTFTFYTKCSPAASTKRSLLSEIAKVFDPLGWLSPVTITAKIPFQSSWKMNQDWDDKLDEIQQQQYSSYQEDLKKLSTLSIPRFVPQNAARLELIGFSDASEKAYAACIYQCNRADPPTGSTCMLLASRTKVAPLKQTSLPRLELCAALLLSELVESVTQALNMDFSIRCYTDSMIVLKWISSTSRRWKTYVANRVAAIQEVVPPEQWSHVPGAENPADLPSRGITVEQLLNSALWWNGPPWLLQQYTRQEAQPPTVDMKAVLEEERSKPILVHHALQQPPFIAEFAERFSSLGKLITTTVIMRRFIQHLSARNPRPKSVTPSADRPTARKTKIEPTERITALHAIIRSTQATHFKEDIMQIRKGAPVNCKSKLLALAPFLDNAGILRVGGRLNKATMAYNNKHPIILSKNSHLTELIVREYHLSHLHASIQLTTAAVSSKYWIVGAKSYIRLIIRKCVICRKAKAAIMQQQMGQLPTSRVTQHRPFLHAGVDFAGPFNITVSRQRRASPDKFYFAIFVCMATKAIHLEAVSSLSTDAFIACFRRFTARRGNTAHLYCDCGSNFVGAERTLKRLLATLEIQMQRKLSELGTTFHFNPPSAPNQGGLWEAGVKAVKHHLKRIVGERNLTLEQFQTLLCQIEACLNSRPITPLSPDPCDMEVLTPGHFLIGAPLTQPADPDVTNLRKNRLDHWQIVQQFTQHFWKRWHSEYLTTLQQRVKWRRPQRNAKVGDMVLVTAENSPPAQWRIGRIVAVHPGQDDLIRTVMVRVVHNVNSNPIQYSEFLRPINKLAIILADDETE